MPYHENSESAQNKSTVVRDRLFKTIVENAGDYIVVASTDGTILYSGNAFEKLGYEGDELIGCNVLDPVHPDDIERARAIFAKMVESDEQQRADFRMRTSGGEYRWMEGAGIRADGDDEPRVVLYARDVTDRKQMEQTDKHQIRQQSALLHEVHHRIKNNMNTVASLLSIHASTLDDPEAVRALEDARSRLHAMHALYDSLYRSENFERMSVRDYLGRLCDQISEIYPASIPITIDKAIADFGLEVTQLSSLGLIINELLTNSIKHAFEGMSEGHIRVSAEHRADNVLVAVHDNGNGIRDDIDPDTHGGFGLSLIRTLSEHLGGNVEVSNNNGTRFEIVFPVEKED